MAKEQPDGDKKIIVISACTICIAGIVLALLTYSHWLSIAYLVGLLSTVALLILDAVFPDRSYRPERGWRKSLAIAIAAMFLLTVIALLLGAFGAVLQLEAVSSSIGAFILTGASLALYYLLAPRRLRSKAGDS